MDNFKTQTPERIAFGGLFIYFPTFASESMRRDFFRAAVFFLMMPRFAALSIALYAVAMSDCASVVLPALMVVFTDFTAPWSAVLRRMLYTRLRDDTRIAFFAFFVIAICGGYYTV